jgi:hypothetical protein
MGGGGWKITVNGNPAKYVYAYYPYQGYLVQEIRAVYSLLSQYKPSTKMVPYRAKYLWLSVSRELGFYTQPLIPH